jgi:beta-aspartyl-peptidase (threonine type)
MSPSRSQSLRPVTADTGRLTLPAIVVHGGAGVFERIRETVDAERLLEGLAAALEAGWAVLSGGDRSTALDAVIEAVAALEDSGRFNAGRGAVTTSSGAHEFDASIMDGTTGKVGAICAATWPANPVRVARALAEAGGVPGGPVLLAGSGADRFAEEQGFAQMTAVMLASASLEGGNARLFSTEGTVGAVAVDIEGNVAAATSTGGRAGQWHGRVGDSPIPGAGVWAAKDTAAVSATGAGEAFVVAGFSHRIDWKMRDGAPLAAAVAAALDAVSALGGDGGGIAITPAGTFTASFNSPAMARGWRHGSGQVVKLFPAETP